MPQIDILPFLSIRRKQTTTMFATNQPPKNIGFFGVFGGSLELTNPHFGTFIKQLLGNEFFINMRKISELFDCNISKDEKILVFNTILKMLSETEAKSTGRKKQYLKMLIYSINDKCNVLKSNLIN